MKKLLNYIYIIFLYVEIRGNNNNYEKIDNIFHKYIEILKNSDFNKTNVDIIKHTDIYFNRFIKNNNDIVDFLNSNNVIDNNVLNTINIINNNYKKNSGLIDFFNKTNTLIGKYILTLRISNPTDDIKYITNNQNIIRFLHDNEDVTSELKDILVEYSKIEKSILDFYDEDSKFYDIEKDKDLVRRFYYKNRKSANKNVKNIYFKKFFSDFWHILIKPYFSGAGVALYLTSFIFTFPKLKDRTLLLVSQLVPVPLFRETVILINSKDIINSLNEKKSLYCGLLFTGGVISSIYSYKRIYNKYKEYNNRYKEIANKIKDLQICLNIMKIVLDVVKNNSELYNYLEDKIKNIQNLIENKNNNKEVQSMVKFLLNTDLGSLHYFSKNAPKILTIFKIFCDNKDIITNAICELGDIDSFLSMSTLLNENEHEICFTNILKNKETPILDQKNIWNIFLNKNNIVKNDITIGDDFNTMLLCGHNGGGKSVYLNSILINLILSQTYGISLASNSNMTLFNKIIHLSTNKDDIFKGKSLYKAEILDLKNYIDLCKNSNKEKFIFTIMDEPLKGTDSKSSIAILKGILSYISKENNNVISILSTHYNELMNLENRNTFKNFYPNVMINENKEIKYTFKITQGKNEISLALPIAENIGIDNNVMSLIKKEYNEI